MSCHALLCCCRSSTAGGGLCAVTVLGQFAWAFLLVVMKGSSSEPWRLQMSSGAAGGWSCHYQLGGCPKTPAHPGVGCPNEQKQDLWMLCREAGGKVTSSFHVYTTNTHRLLPGTLWLLQGRGRGWWWLQKCAIFAVKRVLQNLISFWETSHFFLQKVIPVPISVCPALHARCLQGARHCPPPWCHQSENKASVVLVKVWLPCGFAFQFLSSG